MTSYALNLTDLVAKFTTGQRRSDTPGTEDSLHQGRSLTVDHFTDPGHLVRCKTQLWTVLGTDRL